MSLSPALSFRPLLVGAGCIALLLTSCHKRSSEVKAPAKPKTEEKKEEPGISEDDPRYTAVVTQRVNAATDGAHVRIVWSQSQNRRDPDTFSEGDEQLLMGFDNRDGKGLRPIFKEQGNYTRPVFSTDGQTIVFSRRHVQRKGRLWSQTVELFRTDWLGSPPVNLGNGLVTTCWHDPKTHVEWVYAVQDWNPSKMVATDANRLVRFPLNHPEKVEKVYDDTRLDSDNIQFSRDGLRGSGGFPWPNAGIFINEGGNLNSHKLTNGCWPSCIPDNSRVSWVFNGDHRSATFFADDGAKSWTVDFSLPEGRGREMYHPRWTNHPRYFVITGPFRGKKGNTILNGGRSAEVFLARLSEKLDKVEAWAQITDNNVGDNYPDAWIEGGNTVQLAGFAHASKASAAPSAPKPPGWLVNTESLLFLWHDRSAQNSWRTPDGHRHEARLESLGAARFGRGQEMLADGGLFQLEDSISGEVNKAWDVKAEASMEALVLPENFEGFAPAQHTLSSVLESNSLRVETSDGFLLLKSVDGEGLKSTTALPATPYHLAVTRHDGKLAAFANGKSIELAPAPGVMKGREPMEAVTLGGNWSGGLLNVALYGRALAADEISRNASGSLQRVAQIPAPPLRVVLRAKLVEGSTPPPLETITPYTGSLVACVYEVQQVVSGDFKEKRILVNHWGLLNRQPVTGFPREVGKVYDLTVEKQSDHPELRGERVTDDTTAFDMQPWFDVTTPQIK